MIRRCDTLATAQAEAATGSRIAHMGQGPIEHTLGFAEGARLFTNGLAGCVGIGYLALLSRGRRAAYLNHASYYDVCEGRVRVQPTSAIGRMYEARGVLMVRSQEPMAPATVADNPAYEKLNTRSTLLPLVDDLVRACGGDPEAVTIVPYYPGSSDDPPYARSLAVDVPYFEPGNIFAEGRQISNT